MPLAVDPQHWWQMNATWNKWIPSLNERAVLRARQLVQKSESLQQVLTYPHQRLGEIKSLYTVDSACAQWWPKRHLCSCHHPSSVLEKWWQYICWLHFNSWQLTDAFLWPAAEMRGWWMVCPNVIKEENCTAQSGCSLSYACYILQLKWTGAWPSCANWYIGQWPVLLYTLAEYSEACCLPETTKTAWAWCHFAPGQCNTSLPF